MTPTNALGAGRSYGGARTVSRLWPVESSSRILPCVRPRRTSLRNRVTAMVPPLPPDVWFAIAAAVAVLLFGMAEPAGVLVTAYVVMCGYIAFCVFRRD